MTDVGLLVLLRLVLQHVDLLALAVLHDLGLHSGTLHNGSTDLGVLTVQHGQDLVELHGGLGLGVQLLDEGDVALGDGVLLATRSLENNNTLSFPATLPVLVTSTVNISSSSALKVGLFTFKLLYL